MTQLTRSPHHIIHDMYWGCVISRAVHAAAGLGIADEVSDTPTYIGQIARQLKVHKDSLYRLMRLLASYGIFNETEDKHFANTLLSEVLQTDSKDSIRYAQHMITLSMWNGLGNLEHSIKTGEPAFDNIYGDSVFDYLEKHSSENKQFDMAMGNYAQMENPVIAAAYDFSGFEHIVDIGGGTGGFLVDVLDCAIDASGTLFDQPQVVSDAKFVFSSSMKDRCNIVAGDFFQSVPPGADVYILKRILHDWNDVDALRILKTLKSNLSHTGKILVIDAVVPPGNQRHFSKDLEIFLMTWGGNERSFTEFERLCAQAELRIIQVISTGTALSILELEHI
ncbi:MAG: hypothetical protein ACI936_000725 [Paraglaciecola sp.]|jgi:hypothetical protein